LKVFLLSAEDLLVEGNLFFKEKVSAVLDLKYKVMKARENLMM
jgi:hypothetical protein